MEENFKNDFGSPEENQESGDIQSRSGKAESNNINSYILDKRGRLKSSTKGGTAVLASSRTFIILGWIFAALTLLISPYFAVAGITFGLLANRRTRGSGNYIIIANIALALINILFGLFLFVALRRTLFGY